MNVAELAVHFRRLHACAQGKAWLAENLRPEDDAERFWLECRHGDWLLWLADQSGVDRRHVVGAACSVAGMLVHEDWVCGSYLGGHLEILLTWAGDVGPYPLATAHTVDISHEIVGEIRRIYTSHDDVIGAHAAGAVWFVWSNAVSSVAEQVAFGLRMLRGSALEDALANTADVVRTRIEWRDVEQALVERRNERSKSL